MYNRAYSNGLSTASAFNAQSKQGVVFKFFRLLSSQYVACSQHLYKHQCCFVWDCICKYRSHRIESPYHSINHLLQKSEAFQSVHHVTFILCYNVLSDFFALVFALIRVRKHWRDDITQGKQ